MGFGSFGKPVSMWAKSASVAERPVATRSGARMLSARRCRRTFLKFFPGGFYDATYVDWERDYKWEAHERWRDILGRTRFSDLLGAGAFLEIASRAVKIESRTNLLFSFEKMALRDAVKSEAGAKAFAEGLFAFLYGRAGDRRRFDDWCAVIGTLPRKQTRVLTWPMATAFGFIAQPDRHIFLKPNVTRRAAEIYGFPFHYESRPSWSVYANYLAFAETVQADVSDLHPRDLIDIQSFIWVLGSDEYE